MSTQTQKHMRREGETSNITHDPTHLLGIYSFLLPSGPHGNVYEGTLDGSKVCVQRVQVYAQDKLQKAAKVKISTPELPSSLSLTQLTDDL